MSRSCLISSFLLALLCSPLYAAEDLMLHNTVGDVEVELLIPKEARPVQGVLVHVFNYQMKPHDRWATLCRELKWAHLNTMLSRSANNRPTKIREAIAASLPSFAEQCGLPELAHVPLAGTGFSAGGMVTKVLEAWPDRMLTNGISCSWVRDPNELGDTAAVPELFIIGANPDGFKMLPAIKENFEPAIEQHRPWALGLQHECKHDWANSGTLIVSWMQAITRLRYPQKVDVTRPIPLREVRFEEGWRGDRMTIGGQFTTVAPAAEFKGDPQLATWLPDRATAYIWRAWQTKDSPVDLTAHTVAADGSVKNSLGAFQPRKSFGMTIAPGDDLLLGVNAIGDVAIKKVDFYHGDKLIGTANSAPWQVRWESPAIGCYAVWAQYAEDKAPAVTNPALICVEPN